MPVFKQKPSEYRPPSRDVHKGFSVYALPKSNAIIAIRDSYRHRIPLAARGQVRREEIPLRGPYKKPRDVYQAFVRQRRTPVVVKVRVNLMKEVKKNLDAERVTNRIPRVIGYRIRDRKKGAGDIWFERAPGIPLSSINFKRIPDEERLQIIEDVAALLKKIHQGRPVQTKKGERIRSMAHNDFELKNILRPERAHWKLRLVDNEKSTFRYGPQRSRARHYDMLTFIGSAHKQDLIRNDKEVKLFLSAYLEEPPNSHNVREEHFKLKSEMAEHLHNLLINGYARSVMNTK